MKQITLIIAARTDKNIDNVKPSSIIKKLNILGKVLADTLLHTKSIQAQLAIVAGHNGALFTPYGNTEDGGQLFWKQKTDELFIFSADVAKHCATSAQADEHTLIFLDEEFLYSGTHSPGMTPWYSLYYRVETMPLTELSIWPSNAGAFWLSWEKDSKVDPYTLITRQYRDTMAPLIRKSH